MNKKVSVIIPALNEEECLKELSARLKGVFEKEINYDFKVIIVENGSSDNTFQLSKELSTADSRFSVLKLSRNFGMDGALTAGLDQIDSDACVFMSADLQDPPELIVEFLRLWEKGWENIYGVILSRKSSNPIRRFNTMIFYWLLSLISDSPIPKNVSDFRLLDKKVYSVVREIRERNRFLRGINAWVGFKSIGVNFTRPPRFAGKSKAFTGHVIDLAMKGIFANSIKPLRLISILGLLMSIISIFVILTLTFFWIYRGVPFAGFGSIIALILLLFSLLFLMIGILSEYLGLVFKEVKMRPNYIVSEKFEIEN
jgi:glycosyltransferase involved in cell wall biosynthesis